MADCPTFCTRVDGCNGCAPTDSYFKMLVLEGLCCIASAGGGGGGAVSPSFEKMCDACISDTFFQVNTVNNNSIPLNFRIASAGAGGNFQDACGQLASFLISWGDGATSNGNTANPVTGLPNHIYGQAGDYVISFRFAWTDGSVDTLYLPIRVTAAATTALIPLPTIINMQKAASEGCFIRRYNADGTVTDLTLDGNPYVVFYEARCECPVSSNNVVGSAILVTDDVPLIPVASSFVQLAVTDGVAVTLTPPAGARGATLQLQSDVGTGPARFRVDGVSPTNSSGFLLEIDGTVKLGASASAAANASELSTFRIIATTGNSHILAVQFYS